MTFDVGSYVARIDANRTIKDEMLARMKESRPRQRISVTDLVNPRKAFMQRMHPEIQPSIERKEAMIAGKGFHDIFGRMVSSEEYLEQFVQWEGVVGIIDVFKDIPTELKTTSGVNEETELSESRPAYVEQLAMYCAMVDTPRGRIALYNRGSQGKKPSLLVFDTKFANLEAVRAEMRNRRDALVVALEEGEPHNLPQCPWFGRGCEFESICGCSEALEFKPTIAQMAPPLVQNPDEAKDMLSLLQSSGPMRRAGLNDLVFPRKAYFNRLKKNEESDENRLGAIDKYGQKRALGDTLHFGYGKESSRKPISMGDMQDRVIYFKGVPTILRSVKLNDVVSREYLVRMFPHYFTRLAFECALVGSQKGRLVLHYEKLGEDSKFMVYDITFADIDNIKNEAAERLTAVKSAQEGKLNPKELPSCPAWMRKYCKYQPECGC